MVFHFNIEISEQSTTENDSDLLIQLDRRDDDRLLCAYQWGSRLFGNDVTAASDYDLIVIVDGYLGPLAKSSSAEPGISYGDSTTNDELDPELIHFANVVHCEHLLIPHSNNNNNNYQTNLMYWKKKCSMDLSVFERGYWQNMVIIIYIYL